MSGVRPVARRQSRRVALQVLYAADLAEAARSAPPPVAEEVFEGVAANFDLQEGARLFATELVSGVLRHRAEIDARIAACARNWRVDRMAAAGSRRGGRDLHARRSRRTGIRGLHQR